MMKKFIRVLNPQLKEELLATGYDMVCENKNKTAVFENAYGSDTILEKYGENDYILTDVFFV